MAAWGRVVAPQFRPVPGHPDQGYYGDGGHLENTVRPIAYAAWVNAFLARAEPPSGAPEGRERERFRAHATAALRYLTGSHGNRRGTCLDGKPWGDQWQSAMWARSAGMAGWTLWDRIDDPLRLAVARMVEHEADRFVDARPKSGEWRDTGAEENAWNAQMTALAAAMMPGHARARAWDDAAKRFMYNSFSVAADRTDTTPGDDGRSVAEWVSTVNAHPDFTVENHGLVHVGYLKNTLAMLLENAVEYPLAGRPVPGAAMHHTRETFAVLLRCMSWDAVPIYFGGNDWKIVHTQCSDAVMYAGMSLYGQDRAAARLEDTALRQLLAIQRGQGGYYNVRRDLEYGGLCATRLIGCYLAHATAPAPVVVGGREELDRRVCGVSQLEFAKAILHRTPGKFVSLAWGPQRMALAMPRDGEWVVWPHMASGMGYVNGADASARNAELAVLHSHVETDAFSCTGRLERFRGQVRQDFSFTSLSGDVAVYVERLTVQPGFALQSRETGVVGHEYPLGRNTRKLYFRNGELRVTGYGHAAGVHVLAGDWLNLGGKIGYVVRRQPGRANVMRYHDLEKGEGRVPKLQEWFSLVGDRDASAWAAAGDCACVVVFLNQAPAETARWAKRVEFMTRGETATCRVGEATVQVDWGALRTQVAPSP